MIKRRKHHNNLGLKQIKSGATTEQLKKIADKLNIKFTYKIKN